jgi:aromatic ring-opening dioxygenase catalytic subunit (LigB family)
MGQIVAAMASCHAPALFLRQPGEDPAQLDATVDAMRQLGRVLDETRPDALIILGLDHLEAFSLSVSPTFAVVVAPEVQGSFGPKQYRVRAHQPLGRALLDGLIRREFDVAFSQSAPLSHAFVVLFEYVLAERAIPVVPLFVNVYVPPLPQPRRCYRLGRALAEIVAERPERVAILASGGMSHYPGTEKYPYPEFAFDRWVLGVLERGEASSLLSLTSEKLDEVGNSELLTWYTLLGAIGDQPAEVLTYQPTWHHGLGVVNFPLSAPLAGPPPEPALPALEAAPAAGYQYYQFPPPEAYPLNRLLYALRSSPAERQRFVRDVDGVAAEYGLTAAETAALKTLEPLTVAKAGAHPIMAWTGVQLVSADLRAGRIAADDPAQPGGDH